MLYASSQRLGCYLETLARFRVDIKLYVELGEITGDDDFVPLGVVPREWAEKRTIGAAEHEGAMPKSTAANGSAFYGGNSRPTALRWDCTISTPQCSSPPLRESLRSGHHGSPFKLASMESTTGQDTAMMFRTGRSSNHSS